MKNFLRRQINYVNAGREKENISWWIMMFRIFYALFFGVGSFLAAKCIFINPNERYCTPSRKNFYFSTQHFSYFCPSFAYIFLHSFFFWFSCWFELKCNQLSKQMERNLIWFNGPKPLSTLHLFSAWSKWIAAKNVNLNAQPDWGECKII